MEDRGLQVVDSASCASVLTNQQTALLALRINNDQNALIRALDVIQPRYVILFDTDISYIRQLEVLGIPHNQHFYSRSDVFDLLSTHYHFITLISFSNQWMFQIKLSCSSELICLFR